jgi:ABC-type multidrug transport system ATPase subunit
MSETPFDESPRVIEVTTSPIVIGRSRNAAVRLLHPTVSGSHATLVRQGDSLLLEDSDSTFGTFVNGARVKKIAVRQGDRVIFGTQVAYRVQANGLALEDSPRGVRLIGRDVSIKIGDDVLVKDAGFSIPADAFVGMLGPSGAGKTTMLKCLATVLQPGRGRVLFDDQLDLVEHESELRVMLGYVPQEDVVFKPLSVSENITYTAQLRFGSDRTTAEIAAEVERVVQEVGLGAHSHKLAGKISGGQRKRLSVAIELLKRPRLLLLDEPTSGLDPATETSLMAQLRHLANRGTTVVCTTHLMENVRLFDLVIVFGKREDCGHVAYVGPPDRLLEQFHCKSFTDLYEKLEQGQFEPYRQPQSQTEATTPLSTAKPTPQAARPKTGSSEIATSELLSLKQLIVNLGVEASVVEQLPTLLSRSFRLVWRDPGLRATILVQPLGLGFLNCLSQYAALDTIALKFFSVVIAAWLGLNNSARDLVRERHLYIRDRLAGLKPGAFLLSKCLVHVAIGAGQVLLLLCVLGFFKLTAQESLVGALNKEPSFVWLFFVLMTVYTAALGLGLLVSALMRSEAAAVALLPLLIMPQLLIGAVGTGQAQEVFFPQPSREHVAFGPLVPAMRNIQKLPSSAKLAELASLACYSRPAVLLAKPPNTSDGRASVLFADAVHLLLLALITWACTIFAFKWAEQRWVRLIDVDPN